MLVKMEESVSTRKESKRVFAPTDTLGIFVKQKSPNVPKMSVRIKQHVEIYILATNVSVWMDTMELSASKKIFV